MEIDIYGAHRRAGRACAREGAFFGAGTHGSADTPPPAARALPL